MAGGGRAPGAIPPAAAGGGGRVFNFGSAASAAATATTNPGTAASEVVAPAAGHGGGGRVFNFGSAASAAATATTNPGTAASEVVAPAAGHGGGDNSGVVIDIDELIAASVSGGRGDDPEGNYQHHHLLHTGLPPSSSTSGSSEEENLFTQRDGRVNQGDDDDALGGSEASSGGSSFVEGGSSAAGRFLVDLGDDVDEAAPPSAVGSKASGGESCLVEEVLQEHHPTNNDTNQSSYRGNSGINNNNNSTIPNNSRLSNKKTPKAQALGAAEAGGAVAAVSSDESAASLVNNHQRNVWTSGIIPPTDPATTSKQQDDAMEDVDNSKPTTTMEVVQQHAQDPPSNALHRLVDVSHPFGPALLDPDSTKMEVTKEATAATTTTTTTTTTGNSNQASRASSSAATTTTTTTSNSNQASRASSSAGSFTNILKCWALLTTGTTASNECSSASSSSYPPLRDLFLAGESDHYSSCEIKLPDLSDICHKATVTNEHPVKRSPFFVGSSPAGPDIDISDILRAEELSFAQQILFESNLHESYRCAFGEDQQLALIPIREDQTCNVYIDSHPTHNNSSNNNNVFVERIRGGGPNATLPQSEKKKGRVSSAMSSNTVDLSHLDDSEDEDESIQMLSSEGPKQWNSRRVTLSTTKPKSSTSNSKSIFSSTSVLNTITNSELGAAHLQRRQQKQKQSNAALGSVALGSVHHQRKRKNAATGAAHHPRKRRRNNTAPPGNSGATVDLSHLDDSEDEDEDESIQVMPRSPRTSGIAASTKPRGPTTKPSTKAASTKPRGHTTKPSGMAPATKPRGMAPAEPLLQVESASASAAKLQIAESYFVKIHSLAEEEQYNNKQGVVVSLPDRQTGSVVVAIEGEKETKRIRKENLHVMPDRLCNGKLAILHSLVGDQEKLNGALATIVAITGRKNGFVKVRLEGKNGSELRVPPTSLFLVDNVEDDDCCHGICNGGCGDVCHCDNGEDEEFEDAEFERTLGSAKRRSKIDFFTTEDIGGEYHGCIHKAETDLLDGVNGINQAYCQFAPKEHKESMHRNNSKHAPELWTHDASLIVDSLEGKLEEAATYNQKKAVVKSELKQTLRQVKKWYLEQEKNDGHEFHPTGPNKSVRSAKHFAKKWIEAIENVAKDENKGVLDQEWSFCPSKGHTNLEGETPPTRQTPYCRSNEAHNDAIAEITQNPRVHTMRLLLAVFGCLKDKNGHCKVFALIMVKCGGQIMHLLVRFFLLAVHEHRYRRGVAPSNLGVTIRVTGGRNPNEIATFYGRYVLPRMMQSVRNVRFNVAIEAGGTHRSLSVHPYDFPRNVQISHSVRSAKSLGVFAHHVLRNEFSWLLDIGQQAPSSEGITNRLMDDPRVPFTIQMTNQAAIAILDSVIIKKRSEMGRRGYEASLAKATPEQRSEWGRLGYEATLAKLTHEQLSENGRKGNETRKRLLLQLEEDPTQLLSPCKDPEN